MSYGQSSSADTTIYMLNVQRAEMQVLLYYSSSALIIGSFIEPRRWLRVCFKKHIYMTGHAKLAEAGALHLPP